MSIGSLPKNNHYFQNEDLLDAGQALLSKDASYFELGLELEDDGLEMVPRRSQRGSTIAQSSINLVNLILGCAVLPLPHAAAAIRDTHECLALACLLLAITAVLCGYSFAIIGHSCATLGVSTYASCWSAAVGRSTAWIPRSFCGVKPLVICFAFSMVLADSFKEIFKSAGESIHPMFRPASDRTVALWLITALMIMPLCLLRSLRILALFSGVGVACVAYIGLFMAYRWMEGSYAEGGYYFVELEKESRPRPRFGTASFDPWAAIVLLSLGAQTFQAHFKAPKLFVELENRTVSRYNVVVSIAYFVSLLLALLIAVFGFLTFGGGSTDNILNNYSPHDPLATFARASLSFSLLCGYPLVFHSFHEAVMELAYDKEPPIHIIHMWTFGLIVAITCVATVVSDLGFLLEFTGSLFGVAVAFIMPGLMAMYVHKRGFAEQSFATRIINILVIIAGCALMVLGSIVSVVQYLHEEELESNMPNAQPFVQQSNITL